jgi:transcriptional regulator with XRE-family HTH domain
MSDAAEVDPLGRDLGRTIRRARTTSGMSMRALAVRSGLSQPFLSAVERGLSMPSIATLYRVAEALGVPPSTLLPESAGGEIVVVRAGDGRLVPSSERPGSALGRLVYSDEGQGVEVYEYVTGPDADLDVWYAHDGRKVLHVIDGELIVEFEHHATERLGPGDCVVHDGRIPHRWTVPGPGDTRLFLVVARPPQP